MPVVVMGAPTTGLGGAAAAALRSRRPRAKRTITAKSDNLAVAAWDLGGFSDARRSAPSRSRLSASCLSARRHVKGGLMNFTPASQQIKAASLQLSVAGVSKRFGGVAAVDNVSIEIPKGRVLAIIGPDGAGEKAH